LVARWVVLVADGSILASIKKLLGLDPEPDVFDQDIIIHINTAFFVLQQLGVGPSTTYHIEDETNQWSEFIGVEEIQAVKTYVYFKVRLVFDPPATSFAITAIENQIKELEFRLNVQQEGVRHPWPIV
jgi:hypothetical protein